MAAFPGPEEKCFIYRSVHNAGTGVDFMWYILFELFTLPLQVEIHMANESLIWHYGSCRSEGFTITEQWDRTF